MTRLYRVGSPSKIPGARMSGSYRISGVDLTLYAINGEWSFSPAHVATIVAAQAWLAANQLTTAVFPSRAAALRAYEAAAAINPPPAATPFPRLQRTAGGHFYPGHPEILIAPDGGAWEITGLDDRGPVYADSLKHASMRITEYLHLTSRRRSRA